jgi:hypothetical protein
MKAFVRRLAKVRHAVYGNIVLGVMTALAGLYFDLANIQNRQQNPLFEPAVLMGLGTTVALAATVLVVATYLVAPVLEGEVIVLQQPQLPDVQTHTRSHTDLARVA